MIETIVLLGKCVAYGYEFAEAFVQLLA